MVKFLLSIFLLFQTFALPSAEDPYKIMLQLLHDKKEILCGSNDKNVWADSFLFLESKGRELLPKEPGDEHAFKDLKIHLEIVSIGISAYVLQEAGPLSDADFLYLTQELCEGYR